MLIRMNRPVNTGKRQSNPTQRYKFNQTDMPWGIVAVLARRCGIA